MQFDVAQATPEPPVETKVPSETKSPTKSVRTNLVIIIDKTLAPKFPLAKTSKEPGVSGLFVTPVVRVELGFTKGG